MTFKKLTGIILTGVMVFSIMACGKQQEPGASEPEQGAEAISENVTNTPALTVTPAETKDNGGDKMTEEERQKEIQKAKEEEAKKPADISDVIPAKYLEMRIKDGGTVERFEYGTKDYFGDGSDITKKAYIYLPKDYDPEKKYNVLILCHGIGGSESEWGMTGASSKVKTIMDNLIYYGDIEPFIVVTPNGRSSKDFANTNSDYNSFYLFGQELRNDLIPYLNENYATYGKDGKEFSKVRDHYAMAGLSMGGMQTINIGMCECLDIFSWFGAFSSAPTSYTSSVIIEKLAQEEDYKINYFYNLCGKGDGVAYTSHSSAAKNLALLSDKFTDGENFMWMEMKGGHDFGVWYPGFYNFAQIVFKGLEDDKMTLTDAFKNYDFSNPIFTQHFGADPFAMEYDGRLYIYMTADAFEYEADGSLKRNTYSKIKSIYVVSTDDMTNFTDHGEIPVAGSDGIAKWAHNSWAPSACWAEIDGKPKFFLYFADNGCGIGVLSADSPVGPFTDPLGHGLITRDIPNCGNVLWLFDPAVLVDDDGTGYIYFGGGVPEGKAAAPGTGRVAKLGKDFISIEGDVVALDVPYLFEDSGIHKFNNKYYYTYCTNFNVDQAGTDKYGFHSGEIAMLESDSPMGPFTFKETILKNPGSVFGEGGNNHHAVFKFKDEWYIVYHARTLECAMGIRKDYRSTHCEKININEDGSIGLIKMTYKSRPQLKNVDAYAFNSAVNVTHMGGVEAHDSVVKDNSAFTEITANGEFGSAAAPSACGGVMYAHGFEKGDFIEIQGVDFGEGGKVSLTLCGRGNDDYAEFAVLIDNPDSEPVGTVEMIAGSEFIQSEGETFTAPSGVHTLFIACRTGNNADLLCWRVK